MEIVRVYSAILDRLVLSLNELIRVQEVLALVANDPELGSVAEGTDLSLVDTRVDGGLCRVWYAVQGGTLFIVTLEVLSSP